MKKPARALAASIFQLNILTVMVLGIITPSLNAQTHPFVSFDASGATAGTFPLKINSSGQITGYYQDTSVHAFLRNPSGSLIEFNAPGSSYTQASSINSKGQIVGFARRTTKAPYLGFLRSADGQFTQIVYPAAVLTNVTSINDSGVMTGQYSLAATGTPFHGFVRDASGVFTSFDAPGAGTGDAQGTTTNAINNNGEIVGNYTDANSVQHSFVRDAAGNITTFDAPGSTSTSSADINSHGDVTGTYLDSRARTNAFIRNADGTFTTFTALTSAATYAVSLTTSRQVCGVGLSDVGFQRGFLRDTSGNIVLESGPQPNSGGQCISINDSLRATGTYIDSSGALHAWVK